MSTTSLQRRILDLETIVSQYEERIEEQRIENDRLTNERLILLEGETQEKDNGKRHRMEFGDERVSSVPHLSSGSELTRTGQIRLTKQLGELRNTNTALRNAHEQLKSEHTKVANEYNRLLVDSKAEINVLESHLDVKQGEVDRLKGFQRRSENLSIQLEEEKRRADEGRQGREDETADRKGDQVIRNELRREPGFRLTFASNTEADECV